MIYIWRTSYISFYIDTNNTHEPRRPVHAQTTTIKACCKDFMFLIALPQSLRLSALYLLVSVAATSSSVKHFSSLSKAYLKDACMSYNYVCARFASIVYLTFPFPTSNLHTHKEKEVKSSFEFTNKWLKVLEKTNFSMKPIVSQRVLKTIFLERCCFFSSTS